MDMVHRPAEMSSFEFVVLSGLRTAQLVRGCAPRVEGDHKRTTIAQLEVASGKVIRAAPIVVPGVVVI
jgi:DNA-directed RNA polymerase subunit K/omega